MPEQSFHNRNSKNQRISSALFIFYSPDFPEKKYNLSISPVDLHT